MVREWAGKVWRKVLAAWVRVWVTGRTRVGWSRVFSVSGVSAVRRMA